MVAAADELGCFAVGIADRNSFAGVVRAFDEARNRKIKLLVGTRLVTMDGFEVVAYPTDRAAYGRLCKLITAGNLKAKKGECHLTFEQILSASAGQILIAIPPLTLFVDPIAEARSNTSPWRGEVGPLSGPGGGDRAAKFATHPGSHLRCSPPLPSRGGFRYSPSASPPSPARRRDARSLPASTTIAATNRAVSACWPNLAIAAARRSSPSTTSPITSRSGGRCSMCSLACGRNARSPKRACVLPSTPNATLKRRRKWHGCSKIFRRNRPPVAIANACNFSLKELKYEYPDEPVPEGKTAQAHLEDLTFAGARDRYPKDQYPDGIPSDVEKRLRDELALIAKLEYARYFLTVHDVVAFARRQERKSSVRAAARRPIQRRVLLPRHHVGQSGQEQSSVRAIYFRERAASRPTSTSISSTSGAKKSSNTSTSATDATARRFVRRSCITARAAPFATSARRWA